MYNFTGFYCHQILTKKKQIKNFLLMIVDLWITIRGFSFAKSILEQYKQLHALNTSKAKARGGSRGFQWFPETTQIP